MRFTRRSGTRRTNNNNNNNNNGESGSVNANDETTEAAWSGPVALTDGGESVFYTGIGAAAFDNQIIAVAGKQRIINRARTSDGDNEVENSMIQVTHTPFSRIELDDIISPVPDKTTAEKIIADASSMIAEIRAALEQARECSDAACNAAQETSSAISTISLKFSTYHLHIFFTTFFCFVTNKMLYFLFYGSEIST